MVTVRAQENYEITSRNSGQLASGMKFEQMNERMEPNLQVPD